MSFLNSKINVSILNLISKLLIIIRQAGTLYLVTFREFLVDFLVKVFPLTHRVLEELAVYLLQAGYGGAPSELPETFYTVPLFRAA